MKQLEARLQKHCLDRDSLLHIKGGAKGKGKKGGVPPSGSGLPPDLNIEIGGSLSFCLAN